MSTGVILHSQIKALSRSTNDKIAIIKFIGSNQQGCTFNEIAVSFPKIKSPTLYSFLRKLQQSNLISSNGRGDGEKQKKYFITKEGISTIILSQHPSIRATLGRGPYPYDPNYIINSLMTNLSLNKEAAVRIERKLYGILCTYPLQSISRATIRHILVDILYNSDYEKESYEYTPIGEPIEKIDKRIEEVSTDQIHMFDMGIYFRQHYMARKMPYHIFQYFQRGNYLHNHGFENLLSPINISHDIRLTFLEGLRIDQHVARPATNLDTAFAHILGLMGFTNYDCIRTQGLHHLNYFLAPYIIQGTSKKNRYESLIRNCDGFIKEMFRSYITKPRDYIYSNVILDMEPDSLADKNVIIKGTIDERDTYPRYEKEADFFTECFLKAYADGYDEENMYYYPKVFLNIGNNGMNKIQSDDGLLSNIFHIVQNSYGKSMYFINEQVETSYLSDLSRLEFRKKDELRGKGAIHAISILDIPKEFKYKGLETIIDGIYESLEYIRELSIWKRQIIDEKIRKNEFKVLGKRWRNINGSYFVTESPIVYVRLIELRNIISNSNEYPEGENILKDGIRVLKAINENLKEMESMTEIEFLLGQTSSFSTAISRSKGIGQVTNLTQFPNLVNQLYSPSMEIDNLSTFKSKIKQQYQIQQLLDGGCITRILYDSKKYDVSALQADLKVCMKNRIKLINFRDINHL